MNPFNARRALAAAAMLGAFLGAAPTTARAATPAPAAPASAPISAAPAHGDPNDPSSHAYFTHTVSAGASWSDAVIAANQGDTTASVWVYPVDGETTDRTGSVFANRSDKPYRAGAWLKPGVSSLTLAPHTQQEVAFTVAVPADAAPGDHLAGLALESQQATSGTGGGSFSVNTIFRTVVGALIQVPGGTPAHVTVFGASLVPTASGGTASVTIDMENTGGLLVKPSLSITLDGPGGYHGSYSQQLDTMLPGDRISFPLPWLEPLASGDYTLTLKITLPNGSVTTYSTAAHLDQSLAATPKQGPAPIGAPDTSAGGMPQPLLLAIIIVPGVLLLGAAALLVIRRRRRPLCQHCGEAPQGGALVPVTSIGEMYTCMTCAKHLHNDGEVRLCAPCYKEHAKVRLVS